MKIINFSLKNALHHLPNYKRFLNTKPVKVIDNAADFPELGYVIEFELALLIQACSLDMETFV